MPTNENIWTTFNKIILRLFAAISTVWIIILNRFEIFIGRTSASILDDELENAQTYQEWKILAAQLDGIRGYAEWKVKPDSQIYDHIQIQKRANILSALKKTRDFSHVGYTLRSGLIRNFCGIGDQKLFKKYYLGTKGAIEDYLDQVSSVFSYITDSEFDGDVSAVDKFNLLNDCRQSFGQTALLLQGGSSFGLVHLGVVKCLYEQNLLPKVIAGSSVGALIAALVCTRTNEELPEMLNGSKINLEAFTRKKVSGTISRKITRFLTRGYFLDVKVVEDCVRRNLGELTFDEAYKKTKRILNITVSSTRKFEVPRVLNYLTSPNVLIWSAAVASCSSMGLYDQVTLLAKDEKGDIVHWNTSKIIWNDSPAEELESYETRLSELFNVNHFIVSQATPYIAPFLSTCPQKQRSTGILEFRHRLHQLGQLQLIPSMLLTLVDQKIHGSVTIAPPLSSADFYTIFSSPTSSSIYYWILKGERATWPFLSLIKSRTSVELALERDLNRVRIERERLLVLRNTCIKTRKRRSFL